MNSQHNPTCPKYMFGSMLATAKQSRGSNMLAQGFQLRDVVRKFIACLHDERGVAMTEYLLIMGIMVPLAIYLFHPDNGFYKAARDQYNLTTTFLMFPGP